MHIEDCLDRTKKILTVRKKNNDIPLPYRVICTSNTDDNVLNGDIHLRELFPYMLASTGELRRPRRGAALVLERLSECR